MWCEKKSNRSVGGHDLYRILRATRQVLNFRWSHLIRGPTVVSVSALRELAHLTGGSHSFTSHPTEATFQPKTTAEAGTRFFDPPPEGGMKV